MTTDLSDQPSVRFKAASLNHRSASMLKLQLAGGGRLRSGLETTAGEPFEAVMTAA